MHLQVILFSVHEMFTWWVEMELKSLIFVTVTQGIREPSLHKEVVAVRIRRVYLYAVTIIDLFNGNFFRDDLNFPTV